jgi:predicted Zn-dependent protease
MKSVLFFLLFLVCGGLVIAQSGSGRTGSGQDASGAMSRMEAAAANGVRGFTPQDEYYLGRAVGASILGKYRPLQNPGLTAYLNTICAAITSNSPRPDVFAGYHVLILDSAELNAFATPGGHIFICRGLVQAVASEDALAAILAHELSHVQLRHGIEILTNEEIQFVQEMSGIAGRAASQAAQLSGRQNSPMLTLGNSVRDMVNALVTSGYSQDQEFAADNYAVLLLAGAGYNPASMLDVLNILKNTRQTGGYKSTHPSAAERIRRVEQILPRYQVQDTSSFRANRYQTRIR